MRRTHLTRMGIVTMRLRVIAIRWRVTHRTEDDRVAFLRIRMRYYAINGPRKLIPTFPRGW